MHASVWLLAGPGTMALWQLHLCQTEIQQLAVNFICIWLYLLLKLNVINSYKLTEKCEERFQSFGSDETISLI